MVRIALLTGLFAATAACASIETVASAPITEGVSTVFDYPYNEVRIAAVEAVKELKLVAEGSDETAHRFQVRFSKPVSAFSWGEVGVINIVRSGDTATRVYVNTEKRDQMQISGTSEWQFAQDIFAGMRNALPSASSAAR